MGGTFDWRAYIWNTYVEPLRKESLSRIPALSGNINWHQPTDSAFERSELSDNRANSRALWSRGWQLWSHIGGDSGPTSEATLGSHRSEL
ncbi:BQ5605_C015g07932 [Microbotryum silenes-dioicae]|uniref:BQ5605_C015g07932 protein n=1 Tax=Microbotryum silenes-dioicae TaxID=796604 RepID=A0A2X0MET8_9BASI|nr:BQ5605_C015g07932 [Microbotryum silenes-dioicae]